MASSGGSLAKTQAARASIGTERSRRNEITGNTWESRRLTRAPPKARHSAGLVPLGFLCVFG
jgi:hypothetical protein